MQNKPLLGCEVSKNKHILQWAWDSFILKQAYAFGATNSVKIMESFVSYKWNSQSLAKCCLGAT